MKSGIKIILCTLFIILCYTGLYAQGYLSVDGNLVFIGNADTDSAASPLIPGCGISFPFFLTQHLYIKAALAFTGTNYLYNGVSPVPAEEEHREYLVLMPEADCFFGFKLPITGSLEWGGNAGLAFILRFPISLFESETTVYNAVAGWFYANMRFLYPGTELFLKWNIDKNFGLIFSCKSLFPIFHLWDNAGSPFWDQLILSGSVSVFFGSAAE